MAQNFARECLVDVVARLPQGALSRAWGWLARRKHPKGAIRLLKHAFASGVGINFDDSARPIESFESLEAMFVRALRPGARPMAPQSDAVVSPVDALVGITGTIERGTLLQIKGRAYALARLLDDVDAAARFEGGTFATFYLAPKDYHNIHAPVTGTIEAARLVPGALMPVFEESLRKVEELFCRNERIITYVDTESHGRIAVIKVGATLVGRITVAYDPTLVGNSQKNPQRARLYAKPIAIHRGDLLGTFELGSTVVLLTEAEAIKLTPLPFGSRILVGQKIGTFHRPRVASKPSSGRPHP